MTCSCNKIKIMALSDYFRLSKKNRKKIILTEKKPISVKARNLCLTRLTAINYSKHASAIVAFGAAMSKGLSIQLVKIFDFKAGKAKQSLCSF